MKDTEPWIRSQRTDKRQYMWKRCSLCSFYSIILNNKTLRNCIYHFCDKSVELVSPICSILSLQFSYLDRELVPQQGVNSYRLASPFYFE